MADQADDKPRIYQTKEELVRIIQEKDEIIADLTQQLHGKEATLRGTSEPGWLITTKNPNYAGKMGGVFFQNGRAFLPASHPNAKRLLIQFTSDFGYEAKEITAKEFEATQEDTPIPEPSFIEKISKPNYVN